MPAPCLLLGDGITDDTLLHIARFITNAKDLLRLQLTSKRFGAKVIEAPSFSAPVSGGLGGGKRHLGPRTRAVLLSSPSTATRLLGADTVRRLCLHLRPDYELFPWYASPPFCEFDF